MADDVLRQLEARVARLEEELGRVKRQLAIEQGKPWWKQIIGAFEGDKMFEAIAREGRRIRRADQVLKPAQPKNASGRKRGLKRTKSTQKNKAPD